MLLDFIYDKSEQEQQAIRTIIKRKEVCVENKILISYILEKEDETLMFNIRMPSASNLVKLAYNIGDDDIIHNYITISKLSGEEIKETKQNLAMYDKQLSPVVYGYISYRAQILLSCIVGIFVDKCNKRDFKSDIEEEIIKEYSNAVSQKKTD